MTPWKLAGSQNERAVVETKGVTENTKVCLCASATTPDAIVLSASGYKRKGKANIDLIWSGRAGISSVGIWRNLGRGAFINRVNASQDPTGTG
jgi:hypothetical protein